MKARTLKNIRKDAPLEDRTTEALTPTPAPADNFRPVTTQYVPVDLRPGTLEQLRVACGEHGDAAVEDAKWGAVGGWLMREGHEPGKLSNPYNIASTAHRLCHDEARVLTSYPCQEGKPFRSFMPVLSEEAQQEARTVAAETVADWERNGSSGLVRSITTRFQYINAYKRRERAEATPDA